MKASKVVKMVVAMALALALALPLTGCGNNGKNSGTVKVGILQFVTHVALDDAREGFVQALADNGYVDGQNMELDVQNAQADNTNLKTMSDRFVRNNADLVLAIATPAAQAVAGTTNEIPILFTAVTDPVDARLVQDAQMPGANITGTSDMNPIKEQIDLLVQLCPGAKTVGIIYNSSEDNSVLQAKIAKEAAEALGLKTVEQTVTSSNDVQQAAQSLVQKCDAVYVPTDNTFASAMPALSAAALEAKTPVICGESGMVLEGGLATLGLNYYNLGYQTGEMAVRVLNGEDTANMPVEYLAKYDFCINGTVADALGIAIPAELLQYVVYPE